MIRTFISGLVMLSFVLVTTSTASAQQTSAIAGVVKDTSGGVLPGVTIEAASPALIEKVRSVVADSEGRYNITDLRPGTYTVTFSLNGFSTFKREGIQLTAGFTATVNAEMKVGSLEETITVTGAAPLVDTQNVRQQTVVTKELLQALPTGQANVTAFVTLTPGLVGNADVGGTRGTYTGQQGNAAFHGKTGMRTQYDGMRIQNFCGGLATAYTYNPLTVEQVVMETGGVSAESASTGVSMNLIPKEGGNTFKFAFNGKYTNGHLQGDNLTDDLRSRGLTATPKVKYVHDGGVSVGGPLRRDRVWFFGVFRKWDLSNEVVGIYWNKTPGTPFYTADLSRPAARPEWNQSQGGRITWQVSQKNKVAIFTDIQHNRLDYSSYTGSNPPEAVPGWDLWPTGILQGTWSAPLSSRLLTQAGFTAAIMHFPENRVSGVSANDVSILEQSTGIRYNAPFSVRTPTNVTDRYVQYFTTSYVTGSHAFKVGASVEEGIWDATYEYSPNGVSYQFNRGVPVAVTQDVSPYREHGIGKADVGVFAQDQWVIKKLTLNIGLRYEYFNGYVPAQHLDGGPFVPARDFPAVHGVPAWKDINPRAGLSYDLFGDGRTALKVSLGRYSDFTGGVFTVNNAPVKLSVNEVTRSWIDGNGNFVPDCNLANFAANGECGAIPNTNFGKTNPNATRYADDVTKGWGVRAHSWDFAAEVQHQLAQGVSLTGGYYHSVITNNRITDNLAVSPANYSPYCITAPTTTQNGFLLPGGGGYQVCGLYDINPDKFGQVVNLITQLSHYDPSTKVNCGSQTYANSVVDGGCGISDFFNARFSTRFRSGAQLSGGVDSGRSVRDTCFTVDSPQQLLNCHVVTPTKAQTQIKLNGTYPFPGDFSLSGTFQNLPGISYDANYAASNSEISASLGRNLAGGARSATVPLVAPQTLFEPRRSQLDLRIGKGFRIGDRAHLQANIDLYNALNNSAVTVVNSTLGPQWRKPFEILGARMVQINGLLEF